MNEIWQKEKKEILDQASKDRDAAKEAREDASWARYEAENAERKANERVSDREKRAKDKESELNRREGLINEEVKKKAIAEYKKIRIIHNIPLYISLGYGFVTTILFAILSDAFRSEFRNFVVSIWKVISGMEIWLWNIASNWHWTLKSLICGLVTSLVLFLMWKIISRLRDVLASFADTTTIAFLLLFLAIEVFLSQYLIKLPINLILLYILSFITYLTVRAFIQWDDSEKKKDIASVLLILVSGGIVIWYFFFNRST